MDVIREALNFARKAVIPCASVQRIMRHLLVQFKECVSLSHLRVIGGGSAARYCNDAHLPLHQISRQLRQPIISTLCPTILDSDVLTLEVAGFTKTLPERTYEIVYSNRLTRCRVAQ